MNVYEFRAQRDLIVCFQHNIKIITDFSSMKLQSQVVCTRFRLAVRSNLFLSCWIDIGLCGVCVCVCLCVSGTCVFIHKAVWYTPCIISASVAVCTVECTCTHWTEMYAYSLNNKFDDFHFVRILIWNLHRRNSKFNFIFIFHVKIVVYSHKKLNCNPLLFNRYFQNNCISMLQKIFV